MILRVTFHSTLEWSITTTAPASIDPELFLHEQLAAESVGVAGDVDDHRSVSVSMEKSPLVAS